MKYIAIPVIALLFFGASTTASAQNTSTSISATAALETNTAVPVKTQGRVESKASIIGPIKDSLKLRATETKEEFQTKRKEFMAAVESRKAELKAKIQAVKKERISARKEFVYGQFNSAVVIIESRQARVKAMLEKMKANGKDVSEAEDQLEVSVKALASAKVNLELLKNKNTTAETDAAAVKAIAVKVETSLKEARTSLIKVLDIVTPVTASTSTTVE